MASSVHYSHRMIIFAAAAGDVGDAVA